MKPYFLILFIIIFISCEPDPNEFEDTSNNSDNIGIDFIKGRWIYTGTGMENFSEILVISDTHIYEIMDLGSGGLKYISLEIKFFEYFINANGEEAAHAEMLCILSSDTDMTPPLMVYYCTMALIDENTMRSYFTPTPFSSTDPFPTGLDGPELTNIMLNDGTQYMIFSRTE